MGIKNYLVVSDKIAMKFKAPGDSEATMQNARSGMVIGCEEGHVKSLLERGMLKLAADHQRELADKPKGKSKK